jgi:hypothetical protein
MTEKRQTSQGYIIHILQHFATKLRNITNFVMLFQAVMKILSRLVEIKKLWQKVFKITRWPLELLVLEISILLSFLHSKLSNKVIFPQPSLLYSLVILKNNVLFHNWFICHFKAWSYLVEEWKYWNIITWLESSIVLLSNQYTQFGEFELSEFELFTNQY